MSRGILSRNANYCTSNTEECHKHKVGQKKPPFVRVQVVWFHFYQVQNQVKRPYGVRSQDSGYSGERERGRNREETRKGPLGARKVLLLDLSSHYMGVDNQRKLTEW